VRVGILGAGPAGLLVGWLLRQRGVDVTIFEARPYVGGISRSFRWHGFTCDIGAHRLFTHDETALRFLLSAVPMGRHIRRSRLYLAGKWIRDPANIIEILWRYFPSTAIRIVTSYLLRPRHISVKSFDDFVEARYGAALNRFFFRPYTEKLLGLPSSQISADWAQRKVRIGGLFEFLHESTRKQFGYFYYPIRGGYGAIIERYYRDISECVRVHAPVCGLEIVEGKIEAVIFKKGNTYDREAFDHVISTLPLTTIAQFLGQSFPLAYQDVKCVYLLIGRPLVSDNHWIYFIEKDFAINRLVEFKNLSPIDQPQNHTVLCAEVTSVDLENAVQHVINDLVRCGLVRSDEILDSMVLYEECAYPVFDLSYKEHVAIARKTLECIPNLHLIGRAAEFQHLELDEIYGKALSLVNRLVPVSHTIIGEAQMETSPELPMVWAVILTFNNYEDTKECLRSLRRTNYRNLSILVVDNGSSDGTPEHIKDEFPEVKVIETGHNLGVPWGYNIGFSYALHAGAQYILMLNNDTVVEPQMIHHLVKAAQGNPDVGILMPKVLYYSNPDTIWAAGGRHRFFPPAHVILGQDRPATMFNKPFYLEYAISCGLLIHRRAFEKAGLFDPGYFFYFDDWDFSQRVRAHGLKILFVPEALMWHKVSRSTRRSDRETFFWQVWGESCARFYRRHGQPVFLSLFLHVSFLMVREFLKGNRYMLKYFWKGVCEGLRRPLGPIPTVDDIILPPPSQDYAAL